MCYLMSAERLFNTRDPLARAAVRAIHRGDVEELRRLLAENPELATARLGDAGPDGMTRTLLHVAADWPGHFPNGAESVKVLVEAGADVNAPFTGPHSETPLHWAASSNDLDVLDALLDAGADIEAFGGVIGSGPPLADARAFLQLEAAQRLIERGARVGLHDAATRGLMDHLRACLTASSPASDDLNGAFWGACHGGELGAAELLLAHGADINWIPDWENLTPLDAAVRSGATELVAWLRERGGREANASSTDA